MWTVRSLSTQNLSISIIINIRKGNYNINEFEKFF